MSEWAAAVIAAVLGFNVGFVLGLWWRTKVEEWDEDHPAGPHPRWYEGEDR
jgi:hypothetical protein